MNDRDPSRFFLFELTTGKQRLCYGRTVEEAREIMSYRMTEAEMAMLADKPPLEIRQQDIHQHLKDLG